MNNKFFLLLALSLTVSSAHTAGYSMQHIEAAQKATGVLSAAAVPLMVITGQKDDMAKVVLGHVSQCLSRATESEFLLQKLANAALTASASGRAGYSIVKAVLKERNRELHNNNERVKQRTALLEKRKTALLNSDASTIQAEYHRDARDLAYARNQLGLWRREEWNNPNRQRNIDGWWRDIESLENKIYSPERCEEVKQADLKNAAQLEDGINARYLKGRNQTLLAIASQLSSVILQEIANTASVRMVGKFNNRAVRRVLRGAILAVNATAIPALMDLAFQGHYFDVNDRNRASLENSESFARMKAQPGDYFVGLAKTLAKQAAMQAMYEITGELIMRSADDAGTIEWLSKEKEKAGVEAETALINATTAA